MGSEKLGEILGVIDRAEQTLQKVRTETPTDYQENEAAGKVVDSQMLSAGEDLETAIQMYLQNQQQFTPEDTDAFVQRNAQVRRMFSYLSVEQLAGRLPQLKEAPWPPTEWVAEDNMRADAADAAAEPATNGYEEGVPSAQGADGDTEPG